MPDPLTGTDLQGEKEETARTNTLVVNAWVLFAAAALSRSGDVTVKDAAVLADKLLEELQSRQF